MKQVLISMKSGSQESAWPAAWEKDGCQGPCTKQLECTGKHRKVRKFYLIASTGFFCGVLPRRSLFICLGVSLTGSFLFAPSSPLSSSWTLLAAGGLVVTSLSSRWEKLRVLRLWSAGLSAGGWYTGVPLPGVEGGSRLSMAPISCS